VLGKHRFALVIGPFALTAGLDGSIWVAPLSVSAVIWVGVP
jgi:hypothetical protein